MVDIDKKRKFSRVFVLQACKYEAYRQYQDSYDTFLENPNDKWFTIVAYWSQAVKYFSHRLKMVNNGVLDNDNIEV